VHQKARIAGEAVSQPQTGRPIARLRSQGFEQSIFDQKGSIAGGKSKAGLNLAEPYFRGHHLVGQAMTGKKLAKKK